MIQWNMKTKLCSLFLVANKKGLCGIFWKEQKAIPFAKSAKENKFLFQAVKELQEFVRGERRDFTVTLDFDGTEFQKSVWSQLQKIPYGKTNSYSEIAKKLKTRAVRAVGTANGRNPLSIIIPCHRVIAADGTLGGYAGGLQIKKQLLDLESTELKTNG